MGTSATPSIALQWCVVKSQHPQAQNRTRKTQTLSGVFRRPDVLSKMPRSVNVLFDVLRFSIDSGGRCQASVRDLASITRLSHQTVWRGLRRLRGAHLIQLIKRGAGGRSSVYQLLWRSSLASFPQDLVTPTSCSLSISREKNLPREKRLNPPGTFRPSRSNKPSKKALAWAMSQLRNELSDYQIAVSRKRAITTGIGASIWRGMKSGTIQAGRKLATVLHEMIQRLREAIRIGDSVRSWCSWAAWALQMTLREQSERCQRAEQSRIQSEQIRGEMVAAAQSWEAVTWQSWRELLPSS